MINSVSENKVWLRPLWVRVLIYISGIIFCDLLFTTALQIILAITDRRDSAQNETRVNFGLCVLISISFSCVPLGLIIQIGLWKKDDERYILREMHKAVSQANTIVSDEKVLMGCYSHSKISLVYVSLDGCNRDFAKTFSDMAVTEEMFQRALIFFSSGYTCCLAKRHFQFPQPSSTGHLEGGVCFCQYVSQQLSRGQWK